MSQNVLVGADDNPLGAQTYGNASPIDGEEVAVGSNGFGVRLTACRIFHNYFTQVMTGGGLDETRLRSGHLPIISVSHPAKVKAGFTYHKLATTNTYDTDLSDMMNRIAAEPFDAAVAGGSLYGGLNQPFADFCLQHEVDRETPHPGTELYAGDTATDYILSWQKCWNAWQTAATAAGVAKTRLRFVWIITVSHLTTADTFYPGDGFVDVIGLDPYASSTSTSFTSLTSAGITYVKNKNKPVGFPEINCIHTSGDSTALQNWWIDAAAQINAFTIPCEFLCIWESGPAFNGSAYWNYNINKVADTNGHAFPLAHAGYATLIANLGGNPIRTSVGQALPAAPTGLAGVSSADGTQEALSWSANVGGDNVTGWAILKASGWVTSGGVKVATLGTATPRTFTATGLTPGGKYTFWVAAINATGQGPISVTPLQVQTLAPGAGNNPIISRSQAIVEAANPQSVDFSAAATSPLSRPLTYNWSVKNGLGVVVDTFSGATVTRTYATQDHYTWTLTVADNGTPSLTTPASDSFDIILNPTVTPLLGYDLSNFQPGGFVELISQGLIPIFTTQDTQIGGLLNSVGELGELLSSVGQTFDPALGSTSNTANLASGTVIFAKLKCRSSTLSAIDTITTQAQVGTGSKVAVLDTTYNIVTVDGTQAGALALFSGTAVDAWLTHTAGDTTYVLDTAVSGLTPGQEIVIAVFSPPTTVTTYAHLLGAPGPNSANTANGNSATPVAGSITGQTDIVTPLVLGSYVSSPKPLIILNA